MWSRFVVCIFALSACERVPEQGSSLPQRDRASRVEAHERDNAVGTSSAQASATDAPPECANERSDEGSAFDLDNQVGCTDNLASPRDLYRALTLGTAEEKAGAAFIVLRNHRSHARTVVSRAIAVATESPMCSHLRPLTETFRDCEMDVATRAGAALALGTIAQRHPCLFPTGHCATPQDPLPVWSQNMLERCTTRYPIAVARACTEALGYLTIAQIPLLTNLRDNPKSDPALRVFAGRALTRLTGTPQVTDGTLDDLMKAAKRMGP